MGSSPLGVLAGALRAFVTRWSSGPTIHERQSRSILRRIRFERCSRRPLFAKGPLPEARLFAKCACSQSVSLCELWHLRDAEISQIVSSESTDSDHDHKHVTKTYVNYWEPWSVDLLPPLSIDSQQPRFGPTLTSISRMNTSTACKIDDGDDMGTVGAET